MMRMKWSIRILAMILCLTMMTESMMVSAAALQTPQTAEGEVEVPADLEESEASEEPEDTEGTAPDDEHIETPDTSDNSVIVKELLPPEEDEAEEEEEDEELEEEELPVSALVDESTVDKDIEITTSENEITAAEELADPGYAETVVAAPKARAFAAAASTPYTVSKANVKGTFTNVGNYSSFASAKSAMQSKAAAESTALGKQSYVVRYNGRVVAMNSGIAMVTSTTGNTLTFKNSYGGRVSYVTNGTVMYYYDTESISKIKVGVAGITNYTSYENLMLVPLPFTYGYANSSFNRYEMGYYTKNSSGELVHTLTLFSDKNISTHYESGEKTTTTSYAIDKAPSFMSTNTKYYSMDGVNFYKDIHLKSKAGTYYNYFQYLSYRSKSSYTAAELNTAIKAYAPSGSVLIGKGSSFTSAQSSYGINSLLELAFACHESAYGSSNYAKNRNNLFGINAGDANPDNASYYSSVTSCVKYHANEFISKGYFDALTDGRYMGTNAGNKAVGINVAYASDPYHGEQIAAIAYKLDKKLGSKDRGKYTIGISGTSTPVYKSASTGTVLYKMMNNRSGTALKGLPVIVLGKSGSYYKVQSDMPLVNGAASYKGTYSFNHVGYTKQSDVTVVSGTVVTPPTVKAPTSPKAETVSATELKVSWTKAADVDGYEVRYATAKDGTYTKVKDTTAASLTHSGLTGAKTYYYKIRSYKTVSGEKYYSGYTSVVSAVTKPGKVSGFTLSNTNTTSIKTKWTKMAGVTGYEIYRATKKDGDYSKVKTVTSAGTISWTNNSLKVNSTYYYKIRAYKTVSGKNLFGSFSAIQSLKTKPGQVGGVKLANSSSTGIKLSWTKATDVNGYEIYRSTKKGSGYKKVKTITSKNTASWTNGSLSTGTSYYYKVRAYKTVNGTKLYGAYSAIKSLKVKPKAPGGVKVVSGGSTSAKVSWNKASGASGYEIYRATSKNGSYKKVSTLGSGRRSFTNTKLAKKKTYYYKVRAYKTVKGKKVYGSYSSIVSIKK